jgi:cephalosporin-C deacetylase-like acetyl esterase
MEAFVPFAQRDDIWKDVSPVPQFSDKVEILKIDYNQEADEINSYFRAILQNSEISKRAFDLTTEVINVKYYHN